MEITINCTCGKELSQSGVSSNRSDVVIEVEPCEDCLAEEHNKGYTEGEDSAA